MTSSKPQFISSLIPYTRIFAFEMQQSDLIIASHNKEHQKDHQASLITPSGANFVKFYFCGAVTEMTNPGGRNPSIRIADPTGGITFFVKPKNKEVLSILERISPPIFVSVLAYIERGDKHGKKHQNDSEQHINFQCIIDTLTEISRKERDNWIIETANQTMARVETMHHHLAGTTATVEKPPEMEKLLTYMDPARSKNHYQTSVKQLRVLALMADNALEQVKPIKGTTEDSPAVDHSSTVLSLIQEHSGPRGVEIATIAAIAQKQYQISEAMLLETIKALISEDEIYQPSSGSVKVL
jgi:RPA family protein